MVWIEWRQRVRFSGVRWHLRDLGCRPPPVPTFSWPLTFVNSYLCSNFSIICPTHTNCLNKNAAWTLSVLWIHLAPGWDLIWGRNLELGHFHLGDNGSIFCIACPPGRSSNYSIWLISSTKESFRNMIWPKPFGLARCQTQSFKFEQNEGECVIWFSRADILLRELLLKPHMLPKDPWQGAQGAYICIWLLPKRSPSHLRLTYIKGNCTPTNHVFSFIFVTIIVRRVGRSSSMKIERCHIVAVYSGTNRQVGDTWHKLAHLTIEEVHLAQLRCNPSVNPAGRSVALHRDLTHTEGAA